MARATTTSDVFNAVAEPRRRAILDFLAVQERPVNEVVAMLNLDQPSVSKHLRVLKKVGLVSIRSLGRQRLYRTNAQGLKPVHDWVNTYEQYWKGQLKRIKIAAEAKARVGQYGSNSKKNN